jgi:hypothetical protein
MLTLDNNFAILGALLAQCVLCWIAVMLRVQLLLQTFGLRLLIFNLGD